MGYTDVDWAGNTIDRKSTSRCCFNFGQELFLGSAGNKSPSSVEAQYMAASLAACEAFWLRKLLMGLFGQE
jgi:hypothetical protein